MNTIKPNYAPVVVFAYKRPDHLRHTLSALATCLGANRSPLWILCDGPKARDSDERVKAVRKVATDDVWRKHFAAVSVHTATQNKGLANSIISGVTKLLQESEEIIVLEDDLIVSPDFLNFMNDCLTFYQDEDRVGSITGFCPLPEPPKGYEHDVMAVPRNCSQGWATWADRWEKVDWAARDASLLFSDRTFRKRFNSAGSDRLDRLRRQLNGCIDSWSIRFGLWQTLTGRVTIYPVRNRVKNIGYDGTGVHSGFGLPKNELINLKPEYYCLVHPEESLEILRAFRQTYSGNLLSRLARYLRTV